MVYGYVPSKIDGSEKKFEEIEGLKIPSSYSFRNFLPKVLNQGLEPICVPCSISAHLNWNKNVDNSADNSTDNNIALKQIYNSRTTGGNNGMTFKDAFRFLRKKGVDSDFGNIKIEKYAMVGSKEALKQALILNGPCVGALPVYNEDYEFWKSKVGNHLMGWHAISIVGYDEEGVIIRNSWGESFGDEGYTKLKYEDFGILRDIWTIID